MWCHFNLLAKGGLPGPKSMLKIGMTYNGYNENVDLCERCVRLLLWQMHPGQRTKSYPDEYKKSIDLCAQ